MHCQASDSLLFVLNIILIFLQKVFLSLFSVAAHDCNNRGDIEGAKSLAKTSLLMSGIGVVVGIAVTIFIIVKYVDAVHFANVFPK